MGIGGGGVGTSDFGLAVFWIGFFGNDGLWESDGFWEDTDGLCDNGGFWEDGGGFSVAYLAGKRGDGGGEPEENEAARDDSSESFIVL